MVKLNSALLLEQEPLFHRAEEWFARTDKIPYFETDRLLIAKARLALTQNKPELASQFLQQVHSSDNHWVKLFLLGHSYFDRGQTEKALATWQKAKIPNRYFLRIGRTLSPEDAEEWYQLMVNKVEPSSSLYAALGGAYDDTDVSKSVEYYGKAVELDRGWDGLQQKFNVIYSFGFALQKAGEPDKAKSVYIKGIEESKLTFVTFKTIGYLRLASILQSQGQYAEADNLLQEISEITENTGYYVLLAKNALQWGQNLALADEYFKQVLQTRNYNVDHALQIGEIWIEVGQIEKARYYCFEAIPSKFGDNWQIPTCQAQILMAEGTLLEAYQVIFPLTEQWKDVGQVKQVLNKVCQEMGANDLPSGCQ